MTVGTAELNAERNDDCYVITFNMPFHSGNMKSMRMRFCPHLTCPKTCEIGKMRALWWTADFAQKKLAGY